MTITWQFNKTTGSLQFATVKYFDQNTNKYDTLNYSHVDGKGNLYKFYSDSDPNDINFATYPGTDDSTTPSFNIPIPSNIEINLTEDKKEPIKSTPQTTPSFK